MEAPEKTGALRRYHCLREAVKGNAPYVLAEQPSEAKATPKHILWDRQKSRLVASNLTQAGRSIRAETKRLSVAGRISRPRRRQPLRSSKWGGGTWRTRTG